MIRLLVARSWEPPADEWPVSASGSRVSSAPPNSAGVHDQRSTGMLSTMTMAASSAVHRQVPAVSIRLATDQTADGLSLLVSGWPVMSETVSGTSSAAHTAQMPEATVPIRSAR